MKFRKKPVVVEAIKWMGFSQESMTNFITLIKGSGEKEFHIDGDSLFIHTLEGEMEAKPGDYIIKGVQSEIYPCKADIFEQTYESVID